MAASGVTHLIEPGAREVTYGDYAGRFRALCGAWVELADDAIDGRPSCEACRQLDEQDMADILALQQMPHTPMDVSPAFDPTGGHAKRVRR